MNPLKTLGSNVKVFASVSTTTTDLVNPGLVDDVFGMAGIAQRAEGLVVAARGGRDGYDTNTHTENHEGDFKKGPCQWFYITGNYFPKKARY